jgi:hypothetical protein
MEDNIKIKKMEDDLKDKNGRRPQRKEKKKNGFQKLK